MTQSFLPKPLLFKEWKEHKWWMFAGFVLLVYSPAADLLGVLFRPSPQGFQQGLIWGFIFPALYHFRVTLTASHPFYPSAYGMQGPPAVSGPAAMVAMGLMIALITVERNRGSMWYTLSFPIKRIDALRVKIVLALSIVIGSLLLIFILLLASDLAVQRVIPLQLLFLWLAENVLLQLSLMAIGLALATVITTGLIAGIAAFVLSGTPWALGTAVLSDSSSGTAVSATQSSASAQAGTVASHIATFLRGLSPMHYAAGGMTQTSGSVGNGFLQSLHTPMTWWAAVWLAVWTVIWAALGVYGYLHAPFEHSSRFLQFPRLLPLLLWLLYGFAAFLTANSISGHQNQSAQTPYLLLIHWGLIWIAVGFTATLIRYFHRRQKQSIFS